MALLYVPLLETGNKIYDKAFALACGDFAGNIIPYRAGMLKKTAPVICAGSDYRTPWTRDAAFNTWYAGAMLAPEVAKNTLLSVLAEHDGRPVIAEELGQYWDAIIWAWGAWNYYLVTGDSDFLLTALPAIENTLDDCMEDEFDPVDGLFRGGACFQDGISAYPDRFVSNGNGSGILDCLRDLPRHNYLVDKGHGIPCKALSTNVLYFLAGRCAAKMRCTLDLPENPRLDVFTENLAKAICKAFWRDDAGTFRYLLDAGDTQDRQEGLGIAFAALSGIADETMFRRQLGNLHRTPHGLPCLWPQYERYGKCQDHYARHSGPIWPQVNAAYVSALVDFGYRKEAMHEMDLLAQKAVRDSQFYELYHPDSGIPDGGMQENGAKGIVHWGACKRQTWAATGFIQMVLKAVFGICFSEEKTTLNPILPDGCSEMRLSGVFLRSRNVDVIVRRAEKGQMPSELPFTLLPGSNVIHVS